MNALLNKAEKWLSELGIRTTPCATCLMVNRDDVVNLSDSAELLKELRESFGTNKFYWASFDDNYYYLDCW